MKMVNKKNFYIQEYNNINCLLQKSKDFIFYNHGYYPVHPKCTNLFLDTCGSLYCNLADKFGEATA